MPPKIKDFPNQSELAILQVLWDRGPSTVRQVHENLNQKGTIGYTSVLKTLQIMFEKSMVVRDESSRSHVYQAIASEAKTQGRILRDLLNRVFHGSASQLVMQALSTNKASDEELSDIREMIDQMGKTHK